MSLKQDIDGAAALADWLGHDPKPVNQELSEARARSCAAGNLGNPCPHNVEMRWWEKAKGNIAEWIRREIEIKSGMKVKTIHDGGLGMCRKCGCSLPLKVHVPLTHLKDHTDPEQFKTAPNFCWVKTELEIPF
jgi:hypothetical protein